MAGRKREELAFSMDSFLDVICNLVGIMLILIIVAGLRVSRAPVVLSKSETAPDAPAVPQITAIRLTDIGSWMEPAPDSPEKVAPVEVPIEPPPTELMSRADQLRAQIAALARTTADLKVRAAETRQRRERTDEELRQLATTRQQTQAQVQETAAQAAEATRSLEELEAQAARLAASAAAIAEQVPQSQVLRHNVTPISRQVSEKDELHLRLSGNRVSVVPLDSLAEALKFRLERSRDLFLRINRYEGTAGPVDGFLMRYVVERQQPSAIEELRNGGPFMRIQMTYYELEAGADVVTESADEALVPGSRFLTALASARSGTSLTFWVYPDSFELHRTLQDHAHNAGFDIAARPLPSGVPIAGSPNGSRSAAQ
ncbi:MAG: hypothetical protein JNG89_11695 [Planctomycetaceae bacterium]|nr:hypothetical protein [Planctomycetaceae bacterium]